MFHHPYIHTPNVHNERDPSLVVPFLIDLLHPGSVVDVGCGFGTWISVFEKEGVADVLGIDSTAVDRRLLRIEEEKFLPVDLSKSFTLPRRFDLAMSLEVAEHLPPESTDVFLDSLAALSDVILFSAAVPGQGGQGHINEHWQNWWARRFEERGFIAVDFLRWKFWNETALFYWYRQNMFLAVRPNHAIAARGGTIQNVIHPALWEKRSRQFRDIKEGRIPVVSALKIFIKSVLYALGFRQDS